MSPLLFSLFIGDLGNKLNSTGLGLPLGNVNISVIFFADDIVILARNKDSMRILMGMCVEFFD